MESANTTARAASRPPKETARRIIEASRAVLINKGYAQFSMRNVAAEAGMRLANVQYYFPKRSDLVRALMQDTQERYRAAYRDRLLKTPPDAHQRFKAILEFNLSDVANPETRRFFTQMWALLDTLEAQFGHLLNEFYEMVVAAWSTRVVEVDQSCPAAEARRRATLLAAMIEGLVVVRGAHSSIPAEMKRLTARARTVGMQIALGRVSEGETD
jgi:AcrR family transcriptional regulator